MASQDRQLPRAGTIFDLGAGTGITSAYLKHRAPARKLVLYDIEAPRLEIARERFEKLGASWPEAPELATVFRSGRLQSQEVAANSADGMIAAFLFLYLDEAEKEKVLRWCFRALRPGGSLLVHDFSPPYGDPYDYQVKQLVSTIERGRIRYAERDLVARYGIFAGLVDLGAADKWAQQYHATSLQPFAAMAEQAGFVVDENESAAHYDYLIALLKKPL